MFAAKAFPNYLPQSPTLPSYNHLRSSSLYSRKTLPHPYFHSKSIRKEVNIMKDPLFDPGPKTYTHLIDSLNRRLDLKYRDHSTALDFTLKSAPAPAPSHEQEHLFEQQPIAAPPQEESLFPPDPTE